MQGNSMEVRIIGPERGMSRGGCNEGHQGGQAS